MGDLFDEVRVAVEQGEWAQALELLDGAGDTAETATGLELRAHAAYGNGDFEAAITAFEGLCSWHLAAGDDVAAAGAAATVAMYLMMDTGLMAPVRGWLKRAERLVEGRPDAPAHALIAATRAYERLMSGDLVGLTEWSARAITLGERLDVQPALLFGRVAAARVRIFDGDVEAGFALLDEVGAVLMAGETDALTAGCLYCELICAAQGFALYDRAREWTEVMERWRRDAAFGGLHGRCRVHRAEMLRTSGPCADAEREALAACDELRPWMRREFGWPLVELGTVRLRRGDLAGAEESFREAHQHVWSPHPGLALVRLEQGDVDAASELIADAIDHPVNVPSKERPPLSDLCVAPLLDAQVEIAAAAGEADTAAGAAARLTAIAKRYPSRSVEAIAALARARSALVADRPDDAIADATEAVAAWSDLGAPYESSRARLVLGEARQRSGNVDGAQLDWEAAHSALRCYGATRWAEHAAELLGRDPDTHGARSEAIGGDRPAHPTGRERARIATFSCAGGTRTITFGGRTAHLRDLKGFRYIARAVEQPGREFHVLDLVAVEHGTLRPVKPVDDDADLSTTNGEVGLAVLDDVAREAYRRRLVEIDDDIADATQANDPGRLAMAERDREYLVNELARAVGLGGRSRTTGSSSERARTSVARAVRYAVDRLREVQPELAAHLDRCLDTGTYCSYVPDPVNAVEWHT